MNGNEKSVWDYILAEMFRYSVLFAFILALILTIIVNFAWGFGSPDNDLMRGAYIGGFVAVVTFIASILIYFVLRIIKWWKNKN